VTLPALLKEIAMVTKEDVLSVIYEAIDSHNQGLDDEGAQLEKSPNTALFSSESGLDSLGLVGIIVEVEQLVDEKFDKQITIANEKALSSTRSPFRSVESLCDHILELLQQA
jgi:acyl carrier protein